jgi:hypothetical protein
LFKKSLNKLGKKNYQLHRREEVQNLQEPMKLNS